MTKPLATFTPSGFGGGWIVPLNDDGAQVLGDHFGEPPAYLALIDATGWIVEPQDRADLVDALRDAGLAWLLAL